MTDKELAQIRLELVSAEKSVIEKKYVLDIEMKNRQIADLTSMATAVEPER